MSISKIFLIYKPPPVHLCFFSHLTFLAIKQGGLNIVSFKGDFNIVLQGHSLLLNCLCIDLSLHPIYSHI